MLRFGLLSTLSRVLALNADNLCTNTTRTDPEVQDWSRSAEPGANPKYLQVWQNQTNKLRKVLGFKVSQDSFRKKNDKGWAREIVQKIRHLPCIELTLFSIWHPIWSLKPSQKWNLSTKSFEHKVRSKPWV